MDSAKERKVHIAEEILKLSADSLTTRLRAVSYAVSALAFQSDEHDKKSGTDGANIIKLRNTTLIKKWVPCFFKYLKIFQKKT